MKKIDSKKIIGQPISGKETTKDLLKKAFNGYVGREVRNAYEIIERMIKENHVIVLAFSGALSPIDFKVSCINPLIKAGFIDIITTTYYYYYWCKYLS